ncbi:MAG: SpoIID/LytB domain-containing protein, partial [Acidobacteria bacterium]|nr:SpoIID/LytB domain-containing protein [Acidobacteriota bacterium]
MKLSILTLLMILNVSAAAQQRTVRVRLFWLHPPIHLTVTPEALSVQLCNGCETTRLDQPMDIAARGSTVVAGPKTSSIILLSGRAHVRAMNSPPFEIFGDLRIEARDDWLLLTLTMPLERYVVAVLQGESATFRSAEALKAMAVAARTYAVHFGSRHSLEGFDFCDTTHCQDLRLGNTSPTAQAAAAATEGELLWFEGRPAATYYHQHCGGETEDASALEPNLHVPYLRPHHDDYCIRTPHEWDVEISKSDLSRALGRSIHTLSV